MDRWLLITCIALLTPSCTSTLPVPEVSLQSRGDKGAEQLLRDASRRAGDPWQRLREVEVDLDGEWTRIAAKVQPVLVDAQFRGSSTERYRPGSGEVTQRFRGPGGEKRVERDPGHIAVWRNGERDTDQDSTDAAALVADAYVVFTFGASVLRERGSGWLLTGHRQLSGERCALLSGTVKPGFGPSDADGVIAWIGEDTKRLHRVQITLLGLGSTRGADVDVTFDDFRPGPHGTEWPHHFVERVRRPINVKAHEWRMTGIRATR
jgi:hypothetical protein